MQNSCGDRVVVVLDVSGGWSGVDSDISLGHNAPELLVGYLNGHA